MKEKHRRFAYSIVNSCQSHFARDGDVKADQSKEVKGSPDVPVRIRPDKRSENESVHSIRGSDYGNLNDSRWKLELASFTKALGPALEFCRRALPGLLV